MAEYLIVDGYNIMHAWDWLKKTMENDIGHARAKLVDILTNYQALRDLKVILVFDAHLVKGGVGSREIGAGIEVIYTAEGETADMLIEKLVGQLVGDDKVTVATSDWAEQRLVFGKGAVRMSARELEAEIRTVTQEIQNRLDSSNHYDGKLRGFLNDKARKILEEIRRQK